ncbi:phosphotransferase family protein [Ktedonosporobacter rubrisoli]|nr:aminoglycoside phosphotransferase family protein [Ktedonosporobacter rubrisoli]
MPGSKPTLQPEQVLTFLRSHFATPIENLTMLDGGEVAQAFACRTAGQEYIVRFNFDTMGVNFAKELYVSQHFGSGQIPIPTIVYVGKFQDFQGAISHKIEGQTMKSLPIEAYKQAFPALIETMYAIHQCAVPDGSGYGVFDAKGVGRRSSWREFLSGVNAEGDEDEYFGKWHQLFETSFLERDLYECLYARMSELLAYCPEERYLVHGDYGFDNVLVRENRIVAVLDWIGALYGDFVYDIAWLDLWFPGQQTAEYIRRYYTQRGFELPAYEQRVHCYQCYICLSALRFYAHMNKPEAYQWMRERVLTLLQDNS